MAMSRQWPLDIDNLLNDQNTPKNLRQHPDPNLLEETIANTLRNNKELQNPRNLEVLNKALKDQNTRGRLSEFVKGYLNGQHKGEIPNSTLMTSIVCFSNCRNSARTLMPIQIANLTRTTVAAFRQIRWVLRRSTESIPNRRQCRATQAKKDENVEKVARILARNFGDSAAFRDLALDLAKMLHEDGKNDEMPKLFENMESEWKSMMESKGSQTIRRFRSWSDMFAGHEVAQTRLPVRRRFRQWSSG